MPARLCSGHCVPAPSTQGFLPPALWPRVGEGVFSEVPHALDENCHPSPNPLCCFWDSVSWRGNTGTLWVTCVSLCSSCSLASSSSVPPPGSDTCHPTA